MMSTIKQAWDEEYKRRGIPSSFRKDPTQVVVEMINWLKSIGQEIGGSAADIGCGQGRNSYFLGSLGYRVTGLELLEENARLVNAQSKGLPIQAFAQDASDVWPIPPHSLDLAIDVFCYKHIVDKKKQAKYRMELSKALKKDGYYFISLASENDGYYGPLLKESKDKLILDPQSNIPSFLYSIDELVEEFSDHFRVVWIKEQSSTSPMYGKEYPRKVINAVFIKRYR